MFCYAIILSSKIIRCLTPDFFMRGFLASHSVLLSKIIGQLVCYSALCERQPGPI